jgi:hypothetical protein
MYAKLTEDGMSKEGKNQMIAEYMAKNLSEKFIDEIGVLKDLAGEVDLSEKELKDLYDIVDAPVAERESKQNAFITDLGVRAGLSEKDMQEFIKANSEQLQEQQQPAAPAPQGITAEALQQGHQGLKSAIVPEQSQPQQPQKPQNSLLNELKQATTAREARMAEGGSKMTEVEQSQQPPQPDTVRPGISLADIQKGLSSLKKTEVEEKTEQREDVGMFGSANASSLLQRAKDLNNARKTSNSVNYDSDDDWDDEDDKEKPIKQEVSEEKPQKPQEKKQAASEKFMADQRQRQRSGKTKHVVGSALQKQAEQIGVELKKKQAEKDSHSQPLRRPSRGQESQVR